MGEKRSGINVWDKVRRSRIEKRAVPGFLDCKEDVLFPMVELFFYGKVFTVQAWIIMELGEKKRRGDSLQIFSFLFYNILPVYLPRFSDVNLRVSKLSGTSQFQVQATKPLHAIPCPYGITTFNIINSSR